MRFSFSLALFSHVCCFHLWASQNFWRCDKMKLTFEFAKYSANVGLYGHYVGSCLREKSHDGIYFVCERQSFCGLEKSLGDLSTTNSHLGSENRARTCHIYLKKGTDNQIEKDQSGGMDCDVIERRLMDMWEDVNDCVGIYCNSAPHAKCVDRFGYYECVDSTGRVQETGRNGIVTAF